MIHLQKIVMKKYAVIVAGGSGTRMNNNLPKQFILIRNKPVLYYTIQTFLNSFDDMNVILVLPEEHIAKGQEIIDGYFDNSRIQIISGGRTRFHSVQKGLSLIEDESIIFVHDGVRCVLSKELIHRCYESALKSGTAIPVIKSIDSIRLTVGDENESIDRNRVMMVQTPQTFHSKIILAAYNIDYKDKFTDEALVVEAYGLKVHLIDGDAGNLKITTEKDLKIAEALLPEEL